MTKKPKLFKYSLSALSLLLATNVYAATIINDKDVKHDLSFPLRDVPLFTKVGPAASLEKLIIPNALVRIKAFQGVGLGLSGYTVKAASPEISGSVGTKQYVQWVDPDVGIFDKTTGAIAAGFPKPGSAIWFGFGGPCENQNIGSPSVKFDASIKRWVLERQAWADANVGPFYQCVAISTSEDATGSYYRYAFTLDSLGIDNAVAVWPDAIYLALTMVGPISEGPRACAMDKAKMMNGEPATIQCKQLRFSESTPLRPATYEGGPLPIGYPGFFFGLNAPDSLLMFKFKVDFANPALTTLSSSNIIPVNSFIKPCPVTGGNNCVLQPDTSNFLDVRGDRILSRINFRQFADHNSVVISHNVQGPPTKFNPTVRWYELRMPLDPEANWTVYQQGNVAVDSKSRFNPSVGIDRFQNIAVGYTVSSTAVHPSPEMAYHNYFDPKNFVTVQPLVTGLGSQTSGTQWSRTSTMSLDPDDSCTFWFSGEYLTSDGSMNWNTAITRFKLAACS